MRLRGILCLLGVSASLNDSPMASASPDCTICYGDRDCLSLEQVRCEYYLAADQVLKEPVEDSGDEDNPELRETVDAMVFDLVEKASHMATECIPYISEYSDCTKENICVGCKWCSCDALGAWNCSVVQRCRPSASQNIDHKVLVSVIAKLASNNIARKKRSVQAAHKIKSYNKMQEWWYGIPFNRKVAANDRKPRTGPVFEEGNFTYTTTDPDYLAFNDVLRNIDVDNKNNTRRKPPLDAAHYGSHDYMNSVAEINITTSSNATYNFMDLLHALETTEEDITEAPLQGVTKVVIDLLESAKRNALEQAKSNSNLNDYMELDNKLSEGKQYVDTNNYISDLNALNIMKRETPHEVNDTVTPIENSSNNTNTVAQLTDSVLIPLSNIINEKKLELDGLKRIRENLIKSIQSYQSGEIESKANINTSTDHSDTHFSIYNIQVVPQLAVDGRRANQRTLNKYITKLKHDIIEVVKVAAIIQKITPTERIPDDLKYLIRSLKYYVRKERNKGVTPYHIKGSKTRRHNSVIPSSKQIKDCVVEIIQQLDKDTPKRNALGHLSIPTKRILRTVIKENYIDDFALTGRRVSDDKYNLSNDLQTIGNKWQKMTTDVVKSSVVDRLYAMKLLHLVLSADIDRMKDALKIIDFTRTRRMMAIYPQEGELLIKNINREIKDVSGKLQFLAPYLEEGKPEGFRRSNIEKKKKISFFKRIKKLLKGSKDEIKMLLKKKVPKSEIVEGIAKKKMDELTKRKLFEYEEIMKKWQNNMDIFTKREKRSPRDLYIKNRIKNIIPKYLRGKLNPAIAANDAKKIKKNTSKKHKHTKKRSDAADATTIKVTLGKSAHTIAMKN